MTPFIVHGIVGSPYVRAVLLALEEKGADYRLAAMAPGSHRTPEYRAMHPFGKIPVVDHGDFRLYETHAILRYIDHVIAEPALTPSDAKASARMDQIMSVINCYVLPQLSSGVVFPRLIAPHFGLPVDEAAIVEALPGAENCLAAIDDLLGSNAYVTGETLSLADLMLVPHLDYLAQCPEGKAMLANYPAIGLWLARMEERPSMAATTWDRLEELAQAA